MRLGFDVVASELRKTLDEQVRDISASKSVQVAQLHLKTTFYSSVKGVSTPQWTNHLLLVSCPDPDRRVHHPTILRRS